MRMIVVAAIAALAAASPAALPFAGDVFERAEACAERRMDGLNDPRAPRDEVTSAGDLYHEVSEQMRAFVSCVKRKQHPAFKRAPT
jgi:hypothetical protein